jgi:hypothetical protein
MVREVMMRAQQIERAEISFQRTVRASVSEQDLSAAYLRRGKSLIDRPHTIEYQRPRTGPLAKSTIQSSHFVLMLHAPLSIEIHFSRPFPGQDTASSPGTFCFLLSNAQC